MLTITEAIQNYLETVHHRTRDQHRASGAGASRRERNGEPSPTLTARPRMTATERSYKNGLDAFQAALLDAGIDPGKTDVSAMREDWVDFLIDFLGEKSAATEKLYLSAASNFYQYLAAYELAEVNLPRLKLVINGRARKTGRRIPDFPRKEIEMLIAYAERLAEKSVLPAGGQPESQSDRLAERRRESLRNLRDRAFILFLADTGLRCSEACSLTLGDVDFHEGRLKVTGKGDDQAMVRISERALGALKEYLAARKVDDTARGGRKSKTLPVFTRHDRGVKKGEYSQRLAASSAWDLVRARAVEAVGEESAGLIHPHSFRHYFVTVVLLATDNLEKARRLARHKSITTTQLYAEIDPELDEDYHAIFNRGKTLG